jgi:alpha-glucosidase
MTNRIDRLRPALFLIAWTFGSVSAAAELSIVSPNGAVRFKAFLDEPGLKYEVTFLGKPVIEASPLRMTIDGASITEGIRAGKVEEYQVEETYPTRGVHSWAINRCKGARISLEHPQSHTAYTLDVRAYDDGVAFRFVVPGGQEKRVPDESTTLTLPAGSTAWLHNLRGHYEAQHEKQEVDSIPAEAWAAPPLTFRLPGGAGYASITEAALVNYSGMALQADGRSGFVLRLAHAHPASYPFTLRYGEGEAQRLSHPAAIAGTITTPWRVLMIGADLNALVNSDLVTNLCPPPDATLFPRGPETDWVKPGRAVWEYLDGRKSTLDEMKEYCRLAGELGFEYNVLEGFWSRWSDDDLRGLVEYARGRKVGLWLWRHSKELRDPEARRRFFDKCRDFGIAGVKLDFFDHEAKEVIDLYQAILKECAEHHLLVNFHGSNKPTGESRTWPNELSREAVRGMESRALKERARHDTTLPFTRFLAGHADYTPLHFGDRRGDTTWAHQIASAAVFTSPLLTFAASPRAIVAHPAVDVIKSLPATWDETLVLPGSEIGELAAFARRKGDTWFLAVANGPTARTLSVPLSFLGEGVYRASIVRDRKDDPASVQVEHATLGRSGSVAVELNNGGGFIARFARD